MLLRLPHSIRLNVHFPINYTKQKSNPSELSRLIIKTRFCKTTYQMINLTIPREVT